MVYDWFPSPIGVLLISTESALMLAIATAMFPSPIGVLLISTGYVVNNNILNNSFRPLSGFFLFLQDGYLR